MLLAGDELGRTQKGNNNAYNQDNDVSWLHWAHAEADLVHFVSRLSALRARCPALNHPKFLYGRYELHPGIADIAWFDQHGAPIPPEAWNDPDERSLVLRRAAVSVDGTLICATMLMNPHPSDRVFTLPPPTPARLVLDTAHPDQSEKTVHGASLTVPAHSLSLLIAEIIA